MQITTKNRAKEINNWHLFKPSKYCAGHYKWTGSQDHYVGREVPDIDGVLAVYVERRVDKDGPYAQLMCIHKG